MKMTWAIILFTLAALALERWGFVDWGAWFWGAVITVNNVNLCLCALRRFFPRTWRTLRREAGMYWDVVMRWAWEKAAGQ